MTVFVPNLGKNTKVVHKDSFGIKFQYVLPCDETFPNKSFKSKNKWYYAKQFEVKYQYGFENLILNAYKRTKIEMMMELNSHKINNLVKKQSTLQSLKYYQLSLF